MQGLFSMLLKGTARKAVFFGVNVRNTCSFGHTH